MAYEMSMCLRHTLCTYAMRDIHTHTHTLQVRDRDGNDIETQMSITILTTIQKPTLKTKEAELPLGAQEARIGRNGKPFGTRWVRLKITAEIIGGFALWARGLPRVLKCLFNVAQGCSRSSSGVVVVVEM